MTAQPNREQVLKILFPPSPSIDNNNDVAPILQYDTESLRHTWQFVLGNESDCDEDDEEEVCVVCLDALRGRKRSLHVHNSNSYSFVPFAAGADSNQDHVVVGACSHKYHYDCIMEWMLLDDDYNREQHSDCPTCRQSLFDPEAYRTVEAAMRQQKNSDGSSNMTQNFQRSSLPSSTPHADAAFAVVHDHVPSPRHETDPQQVRVRALRAIGEIFPCYCLFVGVSMIPVLAGRSGGVNFLVLVPLMVTLYIACLVIHVTITDDLTNGACKWCWLILVSLFCLVPPLASIFLMLLVNGTLKL